jgi:DNA polymerase-1
VSVDTSNQSVQGAATPSTGLLKPEHVAYLEKRAVPEQFAIAAGLKSVDIKAAAKFLGFEPSAGGIQIPYTESDPTYSRLRCDATEGARFLAPKGREVPVHIACPAAREPSTPLYVVEGPVKALALANAGFPAVGLGGVSTTLENDHTTKKLNSSWSVVPLKGRKVVVVFDAGRNTNAAVARAEARLALALERAGAKVFVAELPPDPEGEDWGPDDFIKTYGSAELRKVLNAARPANPIDAVKNMTRNIQGDTLASLAGALHAVS